MIIGPGTIAPMSYMIWDAMRCPLASLDQALKVRPLDYWAWYNRGCVALEDLDWYSEALASFERALGIKSDDYWAIYRRGDAYFSTLLKG